MILYLHKATQKPYMETWIAMTRGARPQLLTDKNMQLKARAIRDVELSCRAMMGRAVFKACRLSFFILTTGGMS